MRSMVEAASDSTLGRRRRTIVACDAPSTILRSFHSLRMVPLPRYRGAGGRCASLFDIVDRQSAGAGSAGALVIANVTCKMSAMKVRAAMRLIEEDGWYLVATRRSHRTIWRLERETVS